MFRVMAWREIVHKDISLLWEHNALACHFNIMNNITLVFCTILVTIHLSLRRDMLLLLMAPQTGTLTGDLTLV